MRRDVYHGPLIVGLIAPGWSPDYPRVASPPTPTTEAAPLAGPAKDVIVDAEGAVNGTSATIVLPPPASEDYDFTSVHTASTKQSSGTEGEGFASDVTWEEHDWKVLVTSKEDTFWARIGGTRALQG